jgi:hypothetical protein
VDCTSDPPARRPAELNAQMLIVIRFLGFLAVATIGASLLAYLVTRNRRWLRFALQVLRLSIVAGLVLVLLYALERLL